MNINSAQASVVAAKGAATIRTLTEKNASQATELSELRQWKTSRERDDEIRKIASAMEEKGLNAELTFNEKVASISSYNDLKQVEQAVEMASSGNIKLASVAEDTPGRGGSDEFTSFCIGGN